MVKKVRKLHNPFSENIGSLNEPKVRGLEWDEAVVDMRSPVEDQVEQATEPVSIRPLQVAVVVALMFLVFRLGFLQMARGEEYAKISEGNRTRKLSVRAPRGFILDRYNQHLVKNTATFDLVAVPFDLQKADMNETIYTLSSIYEMNPAEVREVVEKANKRSFEPIVIKSGLTLEEKVLFETQSYKFPGFSVITQPARDYITPEIYSHVLGYTGSISDKELAARKDYEPVDVVGKTGIENEYEKFLKGVNGRQEVEVDATGKLIKVIGSVEPVTGNTVVLNIDKGLQDEFYKYFSVENSGSKGAAVAINPKTGEVLALLSVPGFNNNIFDGGVTTEEYKVFLDDKNLPLFNRAIAGTYPPGSTVKPMVGLAALEEGIIGENTVIQDTGKLVIPNQYNPSISYDFVGWKLDGLGPVNVKSAIAKSSDIFFYVVAAGHNSSKIVPLGITKLSNWYRKFNLNKVTGLDLPGEKPGVVADPAWKAKYFEGDSVLSKWYLGDTYHVGIGQGDMLVTPLQVAFWTATIANNGVGMRPQLLKEVKDADGKVLYSNPHTEIVPKVGQDANIKIIQKGMRETIESGSGVALNNLPITSAGKTGTSQFDGADPKKTHAWFTAYAPYEDPEIAIAIIVEAGGEGHAAAVPIVKNVLKWWADNRHNK